MSALRRINVGFARFWEGFEPSSSIFFRLLKKHYDVRISETPDVVFYSVFRGDMPRGNYVKIFYTGECASPPWGECDWAFSFDYDEHPRHYRLPLYVLYVEDPVELIKTPERVAHWARSKPKFCNFIYFSSARFRNGFFKRLSKIKAVDSPGRCLNNMPPIGGHALARQSRFAPDSSRAKVDFLGQYRFSIAFENRSSPGYTTEKIIEAMLAGSIPIYWGHPSVARDFNPRSFLNYHSHEFVVQSQLPAFLSRWPGLKFLVDRLYVRPRAMDALIAEIMTMETHPDRYLAMLSEPWFEDNRPPAVFELQKLEDRLVEIVECLPRPRDNE